MKLLTKKLEARFKQLSCQDEKLNSAIVVAKFFCPWNQWTWYATEYDSEDQTFFGYVVGLESEFGRFSLAELESITGFGGLKIERDRFWQEKTLREVMDKQIEEAHDYGI